MLVSSTAFADGGSRPNCSPTQITATSTLTASINGLRKDAVAITPSPASFSPATCPAVVHQPCSIDGSCNPLRRAPARYLASTGGSPLSTAFSSPSTSSISAPLVFIRNTAGGNLNSGTYDVRLTVRFVCAQGSSRDWSCRAFSVSVSWTTGGGRNGTITSQTATTTGPPDNSSSCDSPAP